MITPANETLRRRANCGPMVGWYQVGAEPLAPKMQYYYDDTPANEVSHQQPKRSGFAEGQTAVRWWAGIGSV